MQNIKFPNKYNQCQHFCKKVECSFADKCVFGFNRIFGGARELRLDFNHCNLNCKLCWSNNNDNEKEFETTYVLDNFIHCIKMNHKFIVDIIKPEKPATFKIQSFQIIGGEPFISNDRFLFIFDLLKEINKFIVSNFDLCEANLKLDSKSRFRVKLFTNGITIGNETISLSDIKRLEELLNIRIDLLVSFKGLSENAFFELQSDGFSKRNFFEYQINCLEKLVNLNCENVHIL